MGYAENVSIFYEGDVAHAVVYTPLAKQLTRDLHNQLASSGLSSGHHKWDADPSTVILCRVTEGNLSAVIHSKGCLIRMETGAIDKRGINWNSPEFSEPGIYRKPSWLPDNLNWKVHTAGYNESTNVGDPYNGTPNIDGDTSRSMGYDPDNKDATQGDFTAKKAASTRAHSSCYTGKMRLFVQAMYGRPAYEEYPTFDVTEIGVGPPQLMLTWPSKYGLPSTNTMAISTNSGMFRDSTGVYWHLEVGPTEVRVTRMTHTDCSRLMSSYLDTDEAKSLPREQYDTVEAFVLSALTPNEDMQFTITVPNMVGGNYSMGYGYHFNWDGNNADMIQTEYVFVNGSVYNYESTHYRLLFSYMAALELAPEVPERDQEAQRWRITQQIVSTNTWRCKKWYQVIASPDWSNYTLEIFGTQLGSEFGSAPFYCFYTRNELQLARATANLGAGTYNFAGASPTYFGGGAYRTSQSYIDPVPCGYLLCNGESGRLEFGFTSDSSTKTFSCDAASISSANNTYNSEYHSVSIGEPARDGYRYPNSDYYVNGPLSITTGWAATVGPSGCSSGVYASQVRDMGDEYHQMQPQLRIWESFASWGEVIHEEVTRMLCVIPFFDAEAVYIYGNKSINDNEVSGTTSHTNVGSLFDTYGPYWTIWHYNAGWTNEQRIDITGCQDYAIGGGPMPYSTWNLNVIELGSFLVNNSGTHPVTNLPVVGAFFSGSPTTSVAQTFTTITSAVKYDTLTAGSERLNNSGYTGDVLNKSFCFVGGA